MAASPLAAGVGPGGTGFLVVVLLIVAVIVIFVAMAGSLKRLRRSVARGAFDQPGESAGTAAAPDGEAAGRTQASAEHGVTRDPEGPGGAGA
jgi:hypothetical protein